MSELGKEDKLVMWIFHGISDRVNTTTVQGEFFLLPTCGILDMDKKTYFTIAPYRYRIAFAYGPFRLSIGLGQKRPRRKEKE